MGSLLLCAMITLSACLITMGVTRGAWPWRMPCAAVWLWLAAILSVPISAVSALAVLATDRHIWQRSGHILPATAALVCCAVVAAVAAVAVPVAVRLWRANTVARKVRRRHAVLLDLFATRRPDGIEVIADQALFAYSVPCVVSGRIVLSQGAIDALSPDQLAAVRAHEHGHLLGRHHLIVLLADAVGATFFTASAADRFRERIGDLLEISADCYARRKTGPQATAAALLALAGMRPLAMALGAASRAVAARLTHLKRHKYCCGSPPSRCLFLSAAAVLLLPGAAVFLNHIKNLCPWGG